MTGDDVRGVRALLGESQAVFAARFNQADRSVRRWEKIGVRFPATRPDFIVSMYSYSELWHIACMEACGRWRFGYAE